MPVQLLERAIEGRYIREQPLSVGQGLHLTGNALRQFTTRYWPIPPYDVQDIHSERERKNLENDPIFTNPNLVLPGNGLPVLLGPGYSKSKSFYESIEKFCKERGFRVYSPDFSEASPNNATARDFRKFEDAVKQMPGPFLAVAHSNGAMTLRSLAHTYPDKFDSLVMVTGPLLNPVDFLSLHYQIHPRLYDAMMENVATQWNPFSHLTGEAFTPREFYLLQNGYRALKPTINLVTIAAEDDQVVNPAKCVDILSPHARNVVISGGHLSAIEHAATFRELGFALNNFVSRRMPQPLVA